MWVKTLRQLDFRGPTFGKSIERITKNTDKVQWKTIWVQRLDEVVLYNRKLALKTLLFVYQS